MAKILVKSPITSNGRDPILSEDGKMVYKETILSANARPVLEKINSKLPTHLKKVISDIAPTAAIVENIEAPPVKIKKPEIKP